MSLNKKVFIAVLMLSICAFTAKEYNAVSVSAFDYMTPEGYNDNDYQKLLRFYQNNSQHLQWNINDPSKWYGVSWSNSTDKKVTSITLQNCNVAGTLDLSDFTELISLEIIDSKTTHININNCPKLLALICTDNEIRWIAGLNDINPYAYIVLSDNPYFSTVKSSISNSDVVESFKENNNPSFVLNEAITLESYVFENIPTDCSANFIIVDSHEKYLYDWQFNAVQHFEQYDDFNLKVKLTHLDSNKGAISSLKLSDIPPPSSKLTIDVSNIYNDGDELFSYKICDCCDLNDGEPLHLIKENDRNLIVSDGVVAISPKDDGIILSNIPIQIKDNTTTSSNTIATTATTSSQTTDDVIATTSSSSSVTEKSLSSHTTTSSPQSVIEADEFTDKDSSTPHNSLDTNKMPVTNITSSNNDGSISKGTNPSTYADINLFFLPLMIIFFFIINIIAKKKTSNSMRKGQ